MTYFLSQWQNLYFEKKICKLHQVLGEKEKQKKTERGCQIAK